jgi:hypothetical protein
MSKLAWTPWHRVVKIRPDLKSRELSLNIFAADLYDVVLNPFASVRGIKYRAAAGKLNALTSSAYRAHLMRQMRKRRLADAGLPEPFSPHSLRVAAVTDLLTQNAPLEDVQYLARHASPTTARVYDRRQGTEIVAGRVRFLGAPPTDSLEKGTTGEPSLEIDQEAPAWELLRAA